MKKSNITKEQLENIINSCETKLEAAKQLNITTETLRKYLKLYNLTFNTLHWKAGKESSNRQHQEIDKQWLINNWLNTTKSIATLAKEFNISESLLESRISFYQLKKKYKHTFNKEKFFDLNDPHIWYLAGLFVTDGYLSKNSNSITIELVGHDEKLLLESIKDYYESSKEVVEYTKHQVNYHKDGQVISNYWAVSCDGLQEFFNKYFNIPFDKKTFDADVPQAFTNEDCAKAYIRGCLDGDGYITINRAAIILSTASEKFINGLYNIIKQYLNIDGKIFMSKRGEDKFYPTITWLKNDSHTILDWLYSLENCFRLERKYNTYKKICKNEEVMPIYE